MPSKRDTRPERGGEVAVRERSKTRRPRRFKVLLFNDDYTTMEFVVEILMTVFSKTPSEASQVMLEVHQEGQAVAGVYPHDQAETKVLEVQREAREMGHPLRAGMEEA